MSLLDVFSTYLYVLRFLAIAIAVLILVSGLDDLFIDLVYWVRRARRAASSRHQSDELQTEELRRAPEKPLAIMVPAWHETGVIGKMAELAATRLDYENYHIFVGTYPNDPDTQRDVDEVRARFPNVHKIVCARPGPTSKADCLNNVLDAIFQFERRANVEFAGFILHDAEDVISPLELRLFNRLVEDKDLIQIPVYPFERPWWNFTSLHYLDEFAEWHAKNLLAREALAGQMPSAGVGTCFSRRAIQALLADGNGIAFDVQSLTEDYDIGFRLKAKGLSETFVRFSAAPDAGGPPVKFGQSRRERDVVCVREYFPDRFGNAVRQKSRWIIGIVYQGYKTHGWTDNWMLNYLLWGDRKGVITNFVNFAAMLLLLQLVALWLMQALWPGAPRFLSIFDGEILGLLLTANLVLMCNRVLQRIYFVSIYYGAWQGLMSVPRLFWSVGVNFFANWRALRQTLRYGDPHRVAWDKTTHDFPTVGEENRTRRSLGDILVAQGAISQTELDWALAHRRPGMRLGSQLVYEGRIDCEQLAHAVAEQAQAPCEEIDAFALPDKLIEMLPAPLARHYAVLPLREEGRMLVLASESYLDPVSLAALGRKLGRPVRYVIVPKGQVTVGLRRWYVPDTDMPRQLAAIGETEHAPSREFVSRQILLGEILVSLGILDQAAFNSLLLGFERSTLLLGEFLVRAGAIGRAELAYAQELQRIFQSSTTPLPAMTAETWQPMGVAR